jgi:CrcB protein
MKWALIIGLGGGLGSMCRYAVQLWASRHLPVSYPWGTFLVNCSGCFLIGILFALSAKYHWMTLDWRMFLITGLCGGYTTFSSFSHESISLFREGAYGYFFLYTGLSVVLGLLATLAGLSLIK